MTLPPMLKRYLDLGTSHAESEEDRRLIRQCNFTIATVVLSVIPIIAFFSDIGDPQLLLLLIGSNFLAFLIALC